VKYPTRDEALKSDSKFLSASCQSMMSKSRFDSILHCLHRESTASYSFEEYKAKKIPIASSLFEVCLTNLLLIYALV
jgi:hypothetical protein